MMVLRHKAAGRRLPTRASNLAHFQSAHQLSSFGFIVSQHGQDRHNDVHHLCHDAARPHQHWCLVPCRALFPTPRGHAAASASAHQDLQPLFRPPRPPRRRHPPAVRADSRHWRTPPRGAAERIWQWRHRRPPPRLGLRRSGLHRIQDIKAALAAEFFSVHFEAPPTVDV